MLKKMIILFILLIPFSIMAQEEGEVLAGSIILYDSHSSQPFQINSDGGWMEIRQVYQDDFLALPHALPGTLRKWRVKMSYIDESTQNGQTTVQVKLRQYDTQGPVFTLPWTERASRWQEKNSNWYIPYSQNGMILDSNAVLSVRLIAPPQSASPGKIYKIELEAWDFPSEEATVQSPHLEMAYSTPADLIMPARVGQSRNSKAEKENALEFSLDFIRSNIEGDLPGFYKSLSDNIRILESGLLQNRYRIAPPATDLANYNMGDYSNTYRYHIYSFSEYAELFPQWFEEGRRWSPDEKCFLFLGSEVYPGKESFMNEANLVFMVKEIAGEWQIIALPE